MKKMATAVRTLRNGAHVQELVGRTVSPRRAAARGRSPSRTSTRGRRSWTRGTCGRSRSPRPSAETRGEDEAHGHRGQHEGGHGQVHEGVDVLDRCRSCRGCGRGRGRGSCRRRRGRGPGGAGAATTGSCRAGRPSGPSGARLRRGGRDRGSRPGPVEAPEAREAGLARLLGLAPAGEVVARRRARACQHDEGEGRRPERARVQRSRRCPRSAGEEGLAGPERGQERRDRGLEGGEEGGRRREATGRVRSRSGRRKRRSSTRPTAKSRPISIRTSRARRAGKTLTSTRVTRLPKATGMSTKGTRVRTAMADRTRAAGAAGQPHAQQHRAGGRSTTIQEAWPAVFANRE